VTFIRMTELVRAHRRAMFGPRNGVTSTTSQTSPLSVPRRVYLGRGSSTDDLLGRKTRDPPPKVATPVAKPPPDVTTTSHSSRSSAGEAAASLLAKALGRKGVAVQAEDLDSLFEPPSPQEDATARSSELERLLKAERAKSAALGAKLEALSERAAKAEESHLAEKERLLVRMAQALEEASRLRARFASRLDSFSGEIAELRNHYKSTAEASDAERTGLVSAVNAVRSLEGVYEARFGELQTQARELKLAAEDLNRREAELTGQQEQLRADQKEVLARQTELERTAAALKEREQAVTGREVGLDKSVMVLARARAEEEITKTTSNAKETIESLESQLREARATAQELRAELELERSRLLVEDKYPPLPPSPDDADGPKTSDVASLDQEDPPLPETRAPLPFSEPANGEIPRLASQVASEAVEAAMTRFSSV
jgi:hypothetical protein